jgi:hypothetical protein
MTYSAELPEIFVNSGRGMVLVIYGEKRGEKVVTLYVDSVTTERDAQILLALVRMYEGMGNTLYTPVGYVSKEAFNPQSYLRTEDAIPPEWVERVQNAKGYPIAIDL